MKHLLSIFCLFVTLFIGFGLIALSQPTQVNIATVRPPTIQAGTVVAIEGGPFQPHVGETGTTIWFADLGGPLSTYVESSSRLVGMIPTGAHFCGERQVVARTYINLNNQQSFVDSNPVVIDIDCPGGTGQRLARPRIDLLTTVNGLNGQKTLRIKGRNIVPNALASEVIFPNENQKPSPRTEVRVYNDNFDMLAIAQYQSYEEAEIALPPSLPCGEFTVELRNYDGQQVSEPSLDQGRSTLRNTLNCEDNSGVLEPGGDDGTFLVDRLELPDKAYVGERFQGTVYVKLNDNRPGEFTFFAQAQLVLYLNGEERDTRTLRMTDFTNGSSEGKSFPFEFTLQQARSYEIEVRIGDSYKKQTINVEQRNGNGNTPPPTTGGGDLSSYDADSNCKLSDGEFFSVIDAWIGESIENLLFFSGVDAWIGQSDICAAGASSAIALLRTPNGILISSATGDAIGPVSIFDTHGQEVFQSTAVSSRLSWDLRDRKGELMANGVYFIHFSSLQRMMRIAIVR